MHTYELVLLNQIVAGLDHNVIFVAQDIRDLLCNPLLHQIDVDLLDVNLTIELWRKFGGLQALLVNAECHGRCGRSVARSCR